MQSIYGAGDVAGSNRPQPQRLFSPMESFPVSPNFQIPNSSPSILDMDSQQHLQHQRQVHHQPQFQFVRNHPQQQQFRLVIGHQNGTGLPHDLLGLVNGDGGNHQNAIFNTAAVAKHPTLWRYDQNGTSEPQLEKFQKVERQVFVNDCSTVNPNYRQLGNQFASQIPEFENQTSKSKSNTKESAEEEDKKLERQLQQMTGAFQEQILANQERLYQQFMLKISELEKSRISREQSWRAAESERARIEAAARAQERAVAASREAVIVSYLEKITGEKINLPNSSSSSLSPPPIGGVKWPKEEVEALVKVRSEMEGKFREQGHKGALWEEVSGKMGKLGYQKSAKSCKEKWENINKYYLKKAKEESDERATKRRIKSCSYFDQLDQLYSKQDGEDRSNADVLQAKSDESG